MTPDKPVLEIYPTKQRLTSALLRLVEGPADITGALPSAMTIGAFERNLTDEILGHQKTISGMARAMLLSRIIKTRSFAIAQDDKEKRYTTIPAGIVTLAQRFKGFVTATLSFFDELGAGLIGPDDLEKIHDYAPDKERGVAELYKIYRSELEKLGLWDSGMTRKALVDAVDDRVAIAASPTLCNHRAIKLMDIYQFTPYRFELFRRLARWIEVDIVAPVPDERKKAFGYIISNLEKFESLGGEEGKLEIDFDESEPGPLAPLTSRIFDLSIKHAEPETEEFKNRVTVTKCPGRRREVEEACAAIIRIKKETGLDYGAFAVVLRDLNLYAPLIENVFNRYGTPFNFRKGIKLTSNPLTNSILSIFTAIESGYERNDVANIILSPYFKRFSRLDGDVARRLLTESRVMEGPPHYWRAKLEKGVDRMDKPLQAMAREIREETLKLLDMLSDFAAQSRPSAFFDSFGDMLKYLEIDPEPPLTAPMFERIRFRDNNAHTQIIESVSRARDSIEALKISDVQLGFETLQNLFTEDMEGRYIPEPDSSDLNSVAILNAHDAVGSRFAVTFVIGLVEGEFPVFPQPASILNESERMEFNAKHAAVMKKVNPAWVKGRRVFDTWAEKWQEESLLFFQTIRTATEQLHLYYLQIGDDGEPLLPSQFIQDALEAIDPETASKEDNKLVKTAPAVAIERKPGEFLDADETCELLLRNLFRNGFDVKSAAEKFASSGFGAGDADEMTRLMRLASVERLRDRYFIERTKEARAAFLSPFTGQLETARDRILNFHLSERQGRATPTDMEKYGSCPFRYFASRMLDLGPVEEPEPELDAKQSGTLLHEIVERFYKRMISDGALPLKGSEDEKELLIQSARKVFAQWEKDDKQGDPAIWRVEKKRLENMFRVWLNVEVEDQAKNGFIPKAVEAEFDFPECARGEISGPPHPIKAQDGIMRHIAGKVDRIDVDPQNKTVRVLDYKSGSNRSQYTKKLKRENLGVTAFQPPAYMILAKKYVKDAGILPDPSKASGGYRLMKPDTVNKAFAVDYKTSPQSRAEPIDDGVFLAPMDSLAPDVSPETFEAMALGVIGRMESGLYPVTPQTCDHCDFKPLCRYAEAPAPEEEDPES